LVIEASTSAPLTPEITHHVGQFAPVPAVTTPAATARQSASREETIFARAGSESAGESATIDWSVLSAVGAHPTGTITAGTTLALASEVAPLAAIDASRHEPDAVETEPVHFGAGRPMATVADTATSESANADFAPVETAAPEIASLPEPDAARFETAHVEAVAKEPEPVRVKEKSAVSAQQSTAQWMGLAAAAVIAVAVMGVPLGVWLGTRHQAQPEPPQAVAPKLQKAPVAAAAAPSTPTTNREVPPATPQVVADAQPKNGAPGLPPAKANTRTSAKAARKVETAPRPIALQPVPVQVVQGLPASPIVEPQPMAEPPRVVAPTPPAGRLFEPGDVDESPRVATRVEPRLPDDVAKRYPNDVVVVRVLVSQTGHPFRVSLLRHSLGGRSLDDAVVAAVSQWTFSPARKRGEAVSCWMNFGVQIGR
jgi:TonB family protein